ncbi:MAG: hypothetical protein GC201_13685 [Alphaproteobacteria bacterium]|nr:hypothetical protein [Alphaproteobacteria bacterium]
MPSATSIISPRRRLLVPLLAVLAAGQSTPLLAQSSPWTAVQRYQWADDTKGSWEGSSQKTGSYKTKITVYKLDDNGNTSADWYRVDLTIQSTIDRYRKGDKECGWWTDKIVGVFNLTGPGDIVDYGPQSSVGSSSSSFAVGAGLELSGPRLQASYSVNQTKPDAGIKVERDTVKNSIVWIASLTGCKNPGGIPYSGASKVAKATFALNPSVVVQVPEGKQVQFSTKLDKTQSSIEQAKVKLTNLNGEVTRSTKYMFNYALKCGGTTCFKQTDSVTSQ